MKESVNHIHRYKKANLARNGNPPYYVYKCTKPTCSHYVPMELAEGKMCECNRCNEAMIINKAVLTGSAGKPMTLPHCVNCIKRKKENVENVELVNQFLSGNKS